MKKKIYPIVWDKNTYHDLQQILAYVSKESEQAPNIIKQGIKKYFVVLKTNPYIFEADQLKDNNDGTYRAFVVYSYRISYRFIDNRILILRIRHTSREPLEY